AIIPFASGTVPASLSATPAAETAASVGFGNFASIAFPLAPIVPSLMQESFIAPRAGTITALYASAFITSVTTAPVGGPATVTAQLYNAVTALPVGSPV